MSGERKMTKSKLMAMNHDDIVESARERISHYLETIDMRQYSANLIGICLRGVSDKLGNKEANKIIDDMGLEEYGYHKVI